MAITKAMTQFQKLWTAAREADTQQSSLVSYDEVRAALKAIKTGGVTRAEAAFVADTMANDPFMTQPAIKEVHAFLATVGKDHALDTATKKAVMADFALQAAQPFKTLAVPGRRVKNTLDLPDTVQKAMKNVAGPDGQSWEDVDVHKATLAGQPVFIVRYSSLAGESDFEKVRLFSSQGKSIAEGGIDDPMAGFNWH
jgi:hypothetical protein